MLAVIDVVGHGVGAAMYAGMLRSTLDAARRRSPEPKALIGELLDGIDFFEAAKYLLDDDVTLLLVERTGDLPAGPAAAATAKEAGPG